jgi:small subunit ribosomal protein S1
MRQAILDRLNPGDVIEGQISNIVDFGAFVDLDGMDGLIHISELSWSHVNHPSEILEVGQTVKVKVLDIDRDRQRISLGLKQTQSDPWQQVIDAYGDGDEVEGRVTKVVTFGAFVEIVPGVEGLVHISELAQHHVENPREVVSQGDLVRVVVLEIDGERRRLSLSMKRVEGGPVVIEAAPRPAVEPALDDEVEVEVEEVEGEAAAEPVSEDEAEAAPEPEAAGEEEESAEAAAEPANEDEAAAEPTNEDEAEAEAAVKTAPEPEAADEEEKSAEAAASEQVDDGEPKDTESELAEAGDTAADESSE